MGEVTPPTLTSEGGWVTCNPGPKATKEKRKRAPRSSSSKNGGANDVDSDESVRKRTAPASKDKGGDGADSDVSVYSIRSTSSAVSSAFSMTAQSPLPARRSRGRPPTTGEYVGRAAAMRELAEAEREALQLAARCQ